LLKPSTIQACIGPGSSIRACINSGPSFEHVLTQVWRSTFCILFNKWFYVIASSNDVLASKLLLIWKVLIKGFHLRTTQYGSRNFKIWPRGTPFLTLVLTMKVIGDRPSKLIRWLADQVLLSQQVWSWSQK
jgi:hypothetical protein